MFFIGIVEAPAQALNGASILKGAVVDPSNAPVPSVLVELFNTRSGFLTQTETASDGTFRVDGLIPDTYRLRLSAVGFRQFEIDAVIGFSAPADLRIRLELSTQQTSVTVTGTPDYILENKPIISDVVGRQLLAALPALSPDSGLSDAIIFTTPGVAADSNGFFHPLGDHAQVTYVVDGQPISDQRNKVFSTSIPANSIQSIEVISGLPAAEHGDKTSLIIDARTRSGLGQRPSGSFLASYGSFGTVGEEATLSLGGARWGNFIAANSERTGRFLDTPEFWPMHDIGNSESVFDRIDFNPSGRDAVHLNLMAARNWFQVPNTYDQSLQDQRQRVVSFNIAPAYQHTINSRTVLTVNTFVRRDEVNYYPSRNPVNDSPATIAQDRSLTNFGIRSEFSHVQGRQTVKIGVTATRTNLGEEFSLGITDLAYNSPCFSGTSPVPWSSLTNPSQCASLGFGVNSGFLSGLLPYDLARGGRLFQFSGTAEINQLGFYGQDTITIDDLTLNFGLRFELYDGLTRGSAAQPRSGFSYLFKRTKTVIRGGYSHTMETPTNENLVVSSSTGSGGLARNLFSGAAEQQPIALGMRNQYDAGVQQSVGKWAVVDVNYFRKYTRNAFDFDALFSTPIIFPIGWQRSKLDGVSARINSMEFHGLSVYATMGHANARFFGPENGGIIFNSNLAVGAYRQDHDQVYQQNVNVHYRHFRSNWWSDFMWRYDSGLVVGAVNNVQDALALTANQQTTIGFYCGDNQASLSNRITTCNTIDYGAERINILAPGAENDDRNPPRTKSRHTFDLSFGTDNLFRTDRVKTNLRFTVLNLSNQAALYNFLSPFSGTHWAQPRTYQIQMGWAF